MWINKWRWSILFKITCEKYEKHNNFYFYSMHQIWNYIRNHIRMMVNIFGDKQLTVFQNGKTFNINYYLFKIFVWKGMEVIYSTYIQGF